MIHQRTSLRIAVTILVIFTIQNCDPGTEDEETTGFIYSTNQDQITIDAEPFYIRGVVYVPFAAGYLPWEFEYNDNLPDILTQRIDEDIAGIEALGVNTIRLWGAPPYCYERIADQTDLLIIQTIWLETEHEDFGSDDFINTSKTIIDNSIQKIFSVLPTDNPPILAYLIGNELARQNIINTNNARPGLYSFSGTYIQTDTILTATEHSLAILADYLKESVAAYTSVEPLVSYSNEIRTYDFIDTPFMDFRCYNVYSYAVDYYVANPPLGSTSGTITQGFIESLKTTHPELPVLITETGLSVSPEAHHIGPPNYSYGGNTEAEQAAGIIQTILDIETASPPIAGVIIHEFNDAWWKFGLEDSYTQDPSDIEEWFGLTGFTGESTDWELAPRESYYAIKNYWNNQSKTE